MNATNDRPWRFIPPPSYQQSRRGWDDHIALLMSAIATWLAWTTVLGDEPDYTASDSGPSFLLVAILSLLAWNIASRIVRMRRRGPKVLDLGPMPRRLERGATIAISVFSLALFGFGIASNRTIGIQLVIVLCLLHQHLACAPFQVFTRAAIHREGVWADFGTFVHFLSWDLVDGAHIDRERSELQLVVAGATYFVPLSGVDLDFVERAIPSAKLGVFRVPDPDACLLAQDPYA